MINTIETRKVVTIELERSEIYNMLNGAEMRGNAQIRHKSDDVPVDVVVYCSNPEKKDPCIVDADDDSL